MAGASFMARSPKATAQPLLGPETQEDAALGRQRDDPGGVKDAMGIEREHHRCTFLYMVYAGKPRRSSTRRLTGNQSAAGFSQPIGFSGPTQRSPRTSESFSKAATILLALSLLMHPPQTDSATVTIDKFDPGGL